VRIGAMQQTCRVLDQTLQTGHLVLDSSRLWHVTVTVAGEPWPLSSLHGALRRLQRERPFIHSLRYDEDRVELSYWEEGEQMIDAASLALRLWNEHRDSAQLPPWKVVGLEVIDRETYQTRHINTPLANVDEAPRRF
jgi:hypothetical protein